MPLLRNYLLNVNTYIITEREINFLKELDSIINSVSNVKITQQTASNFFYSLLKLFWNTLSIYDQETNQKVNPFLWTTNHAVEATVTGNIATNFSGKNDEYRAYFKNDSSYIFKIIESIIVDVLGRRQNELGIDAESFKLYFSGINYSRIMSEVFAEYFDPENIRHLKIEFGQTIEGVKTKDLGIRTNACMFENELPVILLRVAKYNSDLKRLKTLTTRLAKLKVLSLFKDNRKKIQELKEEIARIKKDNPKMTIFSRKIQLKNSIIYNKRRRGYKKGDIILSSAHKSESFTAEEGDHSNETTRAVINIQELQDFVERAFKTNRENLTIKGTLRAMRKAIIKKAKKVNLDGSIERSKLVGAKLAKRFITRRMIKRASDRKLIAPLQQQVHVQEH